MATLHSFVQEGGINNLLPEILSKIFLKVLHFIEQNPEKYIDILWFGELNFDRKIFNKKSLPILSKLFRRVITCIKRENIKFKNENVIHFSKYLTTKGFSLNQNNKFTILAFLSMLKETNQLHKIYNCGKEYLAKTDRPLTYHECMELHNVGMYIVTRRHKFPNKFIKGLANGILTSDELSYLALSEDSLFTILQILDEKDVYYTILFINYIIRVYPRYTTAIYTLCKELQIYKIPSKVTKAKIRTEKIKQKIMTKYPKNCEAYKYCVNDVVYSPIVFDHLLPECKRTIRCNCV